MMDEGGTQSATIIRDDDQSRWLNGNAANGTAFNVD